MNRDTGEKVVFPVGDGGFIDPQQTGKIILK
jgi:hypothetical protein